MNESLDRRDFNRRGLAAAAAVFGGVFAVPGLAGALGPALGGASGGWSEAGPASDLEEGEPKRFSYEVHAGWERRSETGFLLKTKDAVVAFSARCTHLGCKVRFRDGAFRCPCHRGVFDLDGAPREGPVNAPLARFETRVGNDGTIEVKTT